MKKPDLDELLAALEERAEKKKQLVQAAKTDSCDRFLKKNSIVKGPDRVPNYVIYYTYRKAYKAKLGEVKWSKHHFFRLFNKKFDQVRTGKQRSYMLDGSSFDTSREGLLEAKKYDQEYQIEVKKKRGTYKAPKKKRRSKVSISKKES